MEGPVLTVSFLVGARIYLDAEEEAKKKKKDDDAQVSKERIQPTVNQRKRDSAWSNSSSSSRSNSSSNRRIKKFKHTRRKFLQYIRERERGEKNENKKKENVGAIHDDTENDRSYLLLLP